MRCVSFIGMYNLWLIQCCDGWLTWMPLTISTSDKLLTRAGFGEGLAGMREYSSKTVSMRSTSPPLGRNDTD